MAQRRLKGIAIHRPIVYGNTAQFLLPSERAVPDHTHRWTIAVRSAASPPPGKRGEVQHIGGLDDISYFIKKVSFKLHETYPNPTRVIDKPPFEVTETGWGEFEVQIKIFFVAEANEKVLTVQHLLKLHPWTVKNNLIVPAPEAGPGADPLNSMPVHSWQYDEIVFNDPTEALYNIMVQNAATPLPAVPRPIHSVGPVPISPHNGGAFGELSLETEKKESERLDAARNKVVEELESWRGKLIQYESEIKSLRKDIDGT